MSNYPAILQRKLNRRWDPGATGSVDMLWYSIFRPKRARVGNLEASIERLEDIMRRYVAKRPTKGDFVLSSFKEETKIACLLKLLPEGLEQYIRPDKLQLSSYSLIREEAIRCAEELLVMEEYGRSCLLYTSPSPRDRSLSRMPSST